MSTVNYANPNTDLSVRIFDDFYNYDVNVPADEYDVVHSYFLSVMSTRQAAGNFTVSLFRVAQDTGIPALTLLKEFQGLNGMSPMPVWPTISIVFAVELHCWAWELQWHQTFIKLEMYCYESLGTRSLYNN